MLERLPAKLYVSKVIFVGKVIFRMLHAWFHYLLLVIQAPSLPFFSLFKFRVAELAH